MGYVILDLEWNNTYSRKLKRNFNEIIEFGAIKVDDKLNEIDKFSFLVYPEVSKTISQTIESLTHISNYQLESAEPFPRIFSKFKRFLGDDILTTWGISDILVLMENNNYYNGTHHIKFIKNFLDLQSYCKFSLGIQGHEQLGLITAKDILNLDDTGIKYHRAKDDSKLSLMCFRKLFNDNKINQFVKNSTQKEFYDRLAFKNTFLSSLKDKKIDRTKLYFECDVCGKRAKRISAWQFKNKSHRAVFRCKNCNNQFDGRIQFKLTYDGVDIKKTIVHN